MLKFQMCFDVNLWFSKLNCVFSEYEMNIAAVKLNCVFENQIVFWKIELFFFFFNNIASI